MNCFSLLVGPSCWYLPLSWTVKLLVIVGQHPLSQDYPKLLLIITNHYIDGFLALWAWYLDRLGVIEYSLLSFFWSCGFVIFLSYLNWGVICLSFFLSFQMASTRQKPQKMTINDKKVTKTLILTKKYSTKTTQTNQFRITNQNDKQMTKQ